MGTVAESFSSVRARNAARDAKMASQRRQRAAALAIPCPKCHVPAGTSCTRRGVKGNPKLTTPHRERFKAGSGAALDTLEDSE